MIIQVEFREDRSTLELQVQTMPRIGETFEYREFDAKDELLLGVKGIVTGVEHISITRPSDHPVWPGRTCGTTIFLRDVIESGVDAVRPSAP